jgi:hypothetical protein
VSGIRLRAVCRSLVLEVDLESKPHALRRCAQRASVRRRHREILFDHVQLLSHGVDAIAVAETLLGLEQRVLVDRHFRGLRDVQVLALDATIGAVQELIVQEGRGEAVERFSLTTLPVSMNTLPVFAMLNGLHVGEGADTLAAHRETLLDLQIDALARAGAKR